MFRSDSAFRTLCSAALCGVLLCQPLLAERSVSNKAKTAGTIAAQDRARYALSRFTFGPRPGEIEAVEKTGLDRWFDQQLHPEKLDDTAMLIRLDQYPAMKLSTAELMRRFPSPQMIRVMDRTGASLPSDPIERAIYRSQIEQYRLRTAAQEKGQSPDAMQPQNEMAAGEDNPSKREARLQAAGIAPGQPQRLVKELVALSPQERFQKILAMNTSDLMALRIAGPQRLSSLVEGMTPEQKETLAALGGTPRLVGAELMEQRLIREIYSTHQVEEVMTNFWMNHFNVYVRKNAQEPYYLPSYERDVIRPRALGNFEDLLVAVARSPAMLVYLDNFQSTGPNSVAASQGGFQRTAAQQNAPRGLNENYARELMELHTLGVNGGYTQKDVTEVAKVFTGWTLDPGFRSKQLRSGVFGRGRGQQAAQQVGMSIASANSFAFLERRHEPGSKTVMGVTIKENGEKEGLEVLHMLANSPATAHFISQKLAERFVSDHPDPGLVEKMAASFTRSHGEIKSVLKTMFDAPEFWAKSNEGAKFKTPEEFLVSAVRATGAEVSNPLPLVQAMNSLGMPLYGAQPPTGYKWDQETWLNTAALVNRMNFGIRLGHSLPGVAVGDPSGEQQSEEAKEQALEKALLGRAAGEGTRKTVLAQFRNPELQAQAEKSLAATEEEAQNNGMAPAGVPSRRSRAGATVSILDDQTANMIGLLIGSPEFQRR
ncbi:DUF1800 domain-containing protein [Terriglobus albidus]|uniref:DUF1800 domain-containing protein n=1 Tax=Terriglobus albidus TaxID=1592106 RepID=A0A5B9EFB8_9BACT|nr:DUF1800 domain-containing protein [Terriglobus albidus]QEE29131.1 DUF1800 domain-containing protein [Terriglobus albidus]